MPNWFDVNAPQTGSAGVGGGTAMPAVQPGRVTGGMTAQQMMAANPGMQPWVADAFVKNGITPGPRGSGPGDWQYWQTDALQGASGDTAYLAGRIGQAASGGGGGGGGGGGFDPAVSFMTGGGGGGMVNDFGIGPMGGYGMGPAPYSPGQFGAPSGLTYENDPGYKARMQMGTDAVQAAAAAKGSLLSGGTLKALERYGQDYGSNEFGNVFNRALQTFGANTQAGQMGYQNRYGQYADYLNNLNQVANRGFNSAISLYHPISTG